MSSKTKIVVLRMKEIIYTAIFVGLAILLITLCFIMFRPGKDNVSVSAEPAGYLPGVYSAALTLGSEDVNVKVTVDKNRITSIDLVPLSEAVTTMYPLMQPTLDDLASQEYKDALYPVVKDALTVNGTMYAAARDVTPKVMYLNTKMFEDAGIEIPADTWTMDEFVEIAKQLTKGSGADAQWGYYWKNYTDQTFAMIAAFGGELYSEDGKASVLSTDENTQKAVQFMYDLYNTYKVCPSATQAAQFGDSEFAPFMANKVAMQIGALSTASTFDANGTEYTVLPMPYVDGVSKTSSFVNTWVIPKTAKNPELSWRVVEFLSGKEGQQIALDMNYGLPASTMVDTTEFEAKTPYNKYFVQALETAVPYPTNLNGSEFQNMFQKECESLWAGAVSPEEFAQRVDEQAAPILSK